MSICKLKCRTLIIFFSPVALVTASSSIIPFKSDWISEASWLSSFWDVSSCFFRCRSFPDIGIYDLSKQAKTQQPKTTQNCETAVVHSLTCGYIEIIIQILNPFFCKSRECWYNECNIDLIGIENHKLWSDMFFISPEFRTGGQYIMIEPNWSADDFASYIISAYRTYPPPELLANFFCPIELKVSVC